MPALLGSAKPEANSRDLQLGALSVSFRSFISSEQ